MDVTDRFDHMKPTDEEMAKASYYQDLPESERTEEQKKFLIEMEAKFALWLTTIGVWHALAAPPPPRFSYLGFPKPKTEEEHLARIKRRKGHIHILKRLLENPGHEAISDDGLEMYSLGPVRNCLYILAPPPGKTWHDLDDEEEILRYITEELVPQS